MPHLLLLLLAAAALASCASVSVFGVVGDEDDLYTGTATGYLDRSGPLLDTSGNVVGVVTSSLSGRFARTTGNLPQNINFALKADVARTFLEASGVPIETSGGAANSALPTSARKPARAPSSSTASAKTSA